VRPRGEPRPDASTLEAIGLGGDGDEVDAILEVERSFGVVLDKADAPRWRTAGDVFESHLRALPPERRDAAAAWPIFCAAICEETGADPRRVGSGTLLLGGPSLRDLFVSWFKRLLSRLR
jgi:hypothetical protein